MAQGWLLINNLSHAWFSSVSRCAARTLRARVKQARPGVGRLLTCYWRQYAPQVRFIYRFLVLPRIVDRTVQFGCREWHCYNPCPQNYYWFPPVFDFYPFFHIFSRASSLFVPYSQSLCITLSYLPINYSLFLLYPIPHNSFAHLCLTYILLSFVLSYHLTLSHVHPTLFSCSTPLPFPCFSSSIPRFVLFRLSQSSLTFYVTSNFSHTPSSLFLSYST